MDFVTALQQHVLNDPIRKRKAARLQRLLDAPDSRRKRRKLSMMEHRVASELGITLPTNDGENVSAFDWSSVDWKGLIEKIFKLLMMILPLFI